MSMSSTHRGTANCHFYRLRFAHKNLKVIALSQATCCVRLNCVSALCPSVLSSRDQWGPSQFDRCGIAFRQYEVARYPLATSLNRRNVVM
jgi:hypothetical protein